MEAFRRARSALTIRYCLFSTGTLLVVCLLIVLAFRHKQFSALDRRLLRQAHWLQSSITKPHTDAELDEELAEVSVAHDDLIGAIIFGPRGEVRYQFGIADVPPISRLDYRVAATGIPTTFPLAADLRVRAVAVPRLPPERGQVMVLSFTAGLEARLRDLIWALVLVNLAAAVVAAVLGRRLTSAALRPIRESYQGLQDFLADASHELRTPLTAIVGEAEVTLRKPRSAEDYRRSLEYCASYSRQMMAVVEDLLELSRADTGAALLRSEPVDLGRVVGGEVEALRRLFAEGPQIRYEVAEDAMLLGDVSLVALVARNLLENAVTYTPASGEVRVAVSRVPGRREVLLTVADNGEGVAPEHLPHIFERFYRAEKTRSRERGGTGLGLSIAKAIVEAYGGSISVASELGEGSVFTVRFTNLLPSRDAPQAPR